MTYPHRCRAALACGVAMIVGLVATPALAGKRVALVIGNSAYKNAPQLRNPANDGSPRRAAGLAGSSAATAALGAGR